jgi:ribosomal protein L16 Arg81 hydroxylase
MRAGEKEKHVTKSLSASNVTVSNSGHRRNYAQFAAIAGSSSIPREIHATAAPADRAGCGLTTRSLPILSRLIHPIDVVKFQQEHWDERPLVVHRGDRGYFSDLLTLDDMDRILSLSNPGESNILLVNKTRAVPVAEMVKSTGRNSDVNMLEELYGRYRSGWTVVVRAIQWRWEPLRQLTTALGGEMGAGVSANLYLTPAGSQGFTAHYDTHDVFLAQIYGTKHWRLAMNPYRLPLPKQGYQESQPEPDPELECNLSAGDILYMPRGTIHWATSQETASLHITLGVRPVIYAEAVLDAMFKLFNADVRFRKALPLGFADDEDGTGEATARFTELISELQENLSPRDIVEESAKRTASANPPSLRHHLTDLEELTDIHTGTLVRRRPDQQWHVSKAGDSVSLQFHNKSIRLPAYMEGEIRYMTVGTSDSFTAADVPGDLDEPGRLLLIQILLREGFLTRG